MQNTKRNEIYSLNDVVNSTDLRKHIINVDSRFRTNLVDPSTDFSYRFTSPYKNVIKVRVASVEIPNVWYDFDYQTLHNTFFSVSAYDISGCCRSATIQIADGNYGAVDLVTAVQAQFEEKLQIPYGIFFAIYPDPHSLKVTIVNLGVAIPGAAAPTATAKPFKVNFTSKPLIFQPFDFGLGYNLGFMNTLYTGDTVYDTSGSFIQYSITSESIINVAIDPYIFLAINDNESVTQQTNDNSFEALAKIIVRGDKNQMIFDDGSTLLSNDIIYPSPVDLRFIKVRLLDVYGRPIDLNYCNFSFSLEITEVTNTKMYEFYRNYLWLGALPSVPSNVTGSAMGLLGGKGP